MKVIKRILKEAWKYKKTVLGLLTLIVFVASIDVVTPLIAQNLIDRLIQSFAENVPLSLKEIIISALGILVTTVASHGIYAFVDFRLFTFVTKLEDSLRFKAYEKYLSLHVLYHHEMNSGQMIGRIDRGASGVYSILHDIIGQFLIKPVAVFIVISVLLIIKDPVIAAIVILPLPIFILVSIPLTRKIYFADKKADNAFDKVTREEYDIAGNVLTVKSFAQEHLETQKQQMLQGDARKWQYQAEQYWKWTDILQTFVSTMGRVLVIVVGGYFALQGRITVGEFVLFVTLQGMVYEPLRQLSALFAMTRRQLVRAERLFKIIDEEEGVKDKPAAIELPPFSKKIEFQNVGFAYRAEQQEVLREINVEIPSGSVIALVGRSGSGKSTFVNLLLRSFDPQKGAVIIDGYDIREVKQQSLRSQIAIVSQDVEMFSRSIAENISYGKPNSTPEEIERAAKLAFAHEFIMRAKEGYLAVVGEKGVKLSGGERQRLGIARAILQNPRILILDEATSHLDTESERYVQTATDELMKGRTTIIIAHRLSTVLHADTILVFDRGRIVDSGSHAELIQRCEIYKKLHQLQFADVAV